MNGSTGPLDPASLIAPRDATIVEWTPRPGRSRALRLLAEQVLAMLEADLRDSREAA